MIANTISDKAVVLSRVNYGETDRILNVLCSDHGKLSVIAKGVRAGKSKLAGGIELFAENELVLAKGKGDLHILTSSRMRNYYGDIAKDIESSTYAYECLKLLNKLVPEESGEEYYEPLLSLFKALSRSKMPLEQIKTWFGLRILKNLGSAPNFKTDEKGKNLQQDSRFRYDFDRHCFLETTEGSFGPDHIKLLRHLSSAAGPVAIKTANEKLIYETEHLVDLILKTHFN